MISCFLHNVNTYKVSHKKFISKKVEIINNNKIVSVALDKCKNARSRIIENKLEGCFFLFLSPVGGSNPLGPSPIPFPNPAGQSFPSPNLSGKNKHILYYFQ